MEFGRRYAVTCIVIYVPPLPANIRMTLYIFRNYDNRPTFRCR